MALYSCSIKVVGRASRSAGSTAMRSATAAAAYRAGTRIEDVNSGIVHDYRHKRGVDHACILAPSGAPSWTQDRAALWNAVERAEKRRDAQLFREAMCALPTELSRQQNIDLVKSWATNTFVSKGMVADICFHHLNGHNPHAHIMLSLRSLEAKGFGPKNRDWNDRGLVEVWRKTWAVACNKALADAGQDARLDHRSYARQGITADPTVHMGPQATALERQGIRTDVGDRNRTIMAHRPLLVRITDELLAIKASIRKLLNQLKRLRHQKRQQLQMDAINQQYLEHQAGMSQRLAAHASQNLIPVPTIKRPKP